MNDQPHIPTPTDTTAETVTVIARVNVLGVGVSARAGETLELPAVKATELVAKGYAAPVEDDNGT